MHKQTDIHVRGSIICLKSIQSKNTLEEKRGEKAEQIHSQKQLIQASLNCLLDDTGLNKKTSLQVSYMKCIGRLAKLMNLHVWSFNSGSNYDTIYLHWHQSVNLRSILTPKSFITKTKNA